MSALFRRHKGKLVLATVVGATAVGSYYYPEQASWLVREAMNRSGAQKKLDEIRIGTQTKMQATRERVEDAKLSAYGMLPSFLRKNLERFPPLPAPKSATGSSVKVTPFGSVESDNEAVVSRQTAQKASIDKPKGAETQAKSTTQKNTTNEKAKSDQISKQQPNLKNSVKSEEQPPAASVEDKRVLAGALYGTKVGADDTSTNQKSFKAALFDALSEVQETCTSVFYTVNYRLLYGGDGNAEENNGAQSELFTASEKERERATRQAQNAIDRLIKLVSIGRSDPVLAREPLLDNAQSTALKFKRQLDDLDFLVEKYKRDKEGGGESFKGTPSSYGWQQSGASPSTSASFYANDSKRESEATTKELVEDNGDYDYAKELEAVQQKLLTNQREDEQEQIQQDADSRLGIIFQGMEKRRQHDASEREFGERLAEERQLWEQDLQRYVKVVEEENAKRLEGLIRTQRRLFEIESSQKVEEAVSDLRQKYAIELERAFAHVDGIESALGTRIVQDFENRRTKLYWAACQNLLNAVIYGDDSTNRKTLTELNFLRNFAGTEFSRALIDSFSEQAVSAGVSSEADLKRRFSKAYTVARRMAKVSENGGGYMARLFSYLQNVISWDVSRQYAPDEPINFNDPYEILSRIRFSVSDGDYETALRLSSLLRGEPARIFRDWIKDTREHLEARFLAELIVLNASGTSIRTADS